MEEESYFFRLSKWEKKLLEFYDKNPKFIIPNTRKNEVINFVKKGLKDLSVSRTTFSWGLKVPNEKKHIIYVWLDALTNYLSALNFPNLNDKLYKNFWPANVHIIGKDILRFHAVYWPAFLMAAKLLPPKRVFGHGWILSDQKKMSKSLGNILDPVEIIKKYGVDQLRYYLMKEVSHGNDGSISLENLKNCINNDLANNFGNLCQRVFSFVKKNCNNKIPKVNKFKEKEIETLTDIKLNLKKIVDFVDNQDLNSYIKTVVQYSFTANKYFNDSEPWSLKKTDIIKMNKIVNISLTQIFYIAILFYPVIPITSQKILQVFDIKEDDISFNLIKDKDAIKMGSTLKNLDILFKKIDNDN